MTGHTPWRAITSPSEVAHRIIDVFQREGIATYDEAVTQNEHAVQAAEWAAASGAGDALVAAALLHDLGHLLSGDQRDAGEFRERDLHHEEVAARFLSRWFGPEVTEPIRLHVAAKRYLCAVEPGYHASLSAASVRSLELQGGPMTDAELIAFREADGAVASIELRRWDDLAKDADRPAVDIAAYTDLLAGLVLLPT